MFWFGCFKLGIFILFCSPFTTGHAGRRPKILGPDQQVLHKDQTLTLTCRGHGALNWTLAQRLLSSDGVKVERCHSKHHSHCSKLTVTQLVVSDTGRYTCRSSKAGSEYTTYVFVKDPDQPFVEKNSTTSVLLNYRHESSLVIPCRTTSPNTSVTLTALPNLSRDVVQQMEWDPKVGFKIRYGPYKTYSLLTCNSVIKGRHFKLFYIPKRLSSMLQNAKITPDRVKVLIGDTLTINCSAETSANGVIDFSWDYPNRNKKHQTYPYQNITGSLKVMKKSLRIENVTLEDRGVYHCKAELEPSKHLNVSARVYVFEHPFINVSYKHERPGTVVVNEGRKRIVLEPKVNAVPKPDVTLWFVKPKCNVLCISVDGWDQMLQFSHSIFLGLV